MDNRILVFPGKRVKGWNGETDKLSDVPFHDQVPLREALQTEYDTDAHAVAYHVPGDEKVPRINKSATGRLQIEAPGQIPELTSVWIDVDAPEHGERDAPIWEERPERWLDQIKGAIENTPELRRAGFYWTRGGMRFVWPLETPISVFMAESYLDQFHAYLEDLGLPLDTACSDWTRLFRLPFVSRDGQFDGPGTVPHDFSRMEPLDWTAPEALVKREPASRGEVLVDEMPAPNDLKSPTKKEMKPLESADYYNALREGYPLASKGERHDTLKRIAASIVARVDTNDPTIPFRFMFESVKAMRARDAERDGLPWSEVWDLCKWVCRTHDGTKQLEEREQQSLIEQAAEAMGCRPREVENRLVLATATSGQYYVWDEERLEYARPINQANMLLMQVERKCPRLSGILYDSNTSVTEILRKYATPVHKVVLDYTVNETRFNSSTSSVTEAIAKVDPDLRPEYNREIHGFLEALGGNQTDRFLDWLATLLDFDRGTCALYLKGPPGVGKTVLVKGITRLWGQQTATPYQQLISDFQDSLRECPIVHADEKVPQNAFADDASANFRELIGSGSMSVNEKYKSPATLEGFMRIIITANNDDALPVSESLESMDVDAIRQRIGYIETGSAAKEYLQRLAVESGESVADYIEPWIEGGGLARHILWLHEHRPVEPGDRFLVDGWESKLTSKLAVKVGSVPIVSKAIATVIRDKRESRAVVYGDGEVLVELDWLREDWSTILNSKSWSLPDDSDMLEAIKVLSESEPVKRVPPSQDVPHYYWKVEPELIARAAEEYHVTGRETVLQTVEMDRDLLFDSQGTDVISDTLSGSESA